MTKRMLIEATHPEETRVVVVDGKRLEEFDYESANKRQLKGNIYLAKVTRVEPSLQAAFVDYGGNRHGFLAFSEIHPDYYRIPVADREALLAEHAAMAAEEAAEDAEEDLAANVRADLASSVEVTTETSEAGPAPVDDDGGAREDDGEPAGGAMPLLMPMERLAGPEISDGDEDSGQGSDPAAPSDASAGIEAEAADQATASATEPPSGTNGGDGAEAAGPPASLETIDGDEAEEVRRRASRRLRRYKIQEVVKRRQIMLVQVTKEERGNKGAALTTYLSLAGRYCVLMPNTGRGGGISRKITNAGDRKRLKSILEEFEIPDGMAVIVRTAGSERNKTELRRDYEYLVRLWDEIRELTLQSTAPTLIYEEASLIKRAIRDLYARDIEEVLVEGEDAYKAAKNFMRMLMPSHAKRVQLYKDDGGHLLHHFQVENQLDAIHNPTVNLRSGGYIVINATEALVAIDVNSGRATRERNIEETALRTNLEAADEIARQLRLRDLAGLIVIDFIDMEENRNNAAVERRLKEAMRHDRARIQVGRISAFGLLELSRQRLRPSLIEASTELCKHCRGTGHVRSTESTALHVLRAIEEEGVKNRGSTLNVAVPTNVALYVLNNKRAALTDLEQRHGVRLTLSGDDALIPPDYRMERIKTQAIPIEARAPVSQPDIMGDEELPDEDIAEEEETTTAPANESGPEQPGGRRRRRRRRRRDEGRAPPGDGGPHEHRRGRPESPPPVMAEQDGESAAQDDEAAPSGELAAESRSASEPSGQDGDAQRRRRRRGRRGGRRRRRGGERGQGSGEGEQSSLQLSGESEGPSEFATEHPADEAPEREHEYERDSSPIAETPHEEPPDAAVEPPRWQTSESAPVEPVVEPNGSGGAAVAPEEPEAPPIPAGPPKRGWWKRLIE